MTLYHGTSKASWQPHQGACLTTSREIAAQYGRLIVAVEVELGELTTDDRTADVDRDEQSWPGDTQRSLDALAAAGLDLVTYDDETPTGREHLCYRLVSPAAVQAVAVL